MRGLKRPERLPLRVGGLLLAKVDVQRNRWKGNMRLARIRKIQTRPTGKVVFFVLHWADEDDLADEERERLCRPPGDCALPDVITQLGGLVSGDAG